MKKKKPRHSPSSSYANSPSNLYINIYGIYSNPCSGVVVVANDPLNVSGALRSPPPTSSHPHLSRRNESSHPQLERTLSQQEEKSVKKKKKELLLDFYSYFMVLESFLF